MLVDTLLFTPGRLLGYVEIHTILRMYVVVTYLLLCTLIHLFTRTRISAVYLQTHECNPCVQMFVAVNTTKHVICS